MISDHIKAIYRIIMASKTPVNKLWIVEGKDYNRYISISDSIINTDFLSVDGKHYHIVSGKRPTFQLTFPLELFIKDEVGWQK